jgi:hypothetical protein
VAKSKLAAVETETTESWSAAEEQRLPLTVRSTLEALVSEKAARADASARAVAEAPSFCPGFRGGPFRLRNAKAEVQTWRCSHRSNGFVCGFDGFVVCSVETRRLVRREICR